MYLNSGKHITRPRVTEIPVTEVVLKAVEAMAEAQGIKSLKLKNRHKTVFYPANWLAGVTTRKTIRMTMKTMMKNTKDKNQTMIMAMKSEMKKLTT